MSKVIKQLPTFVHRTYRGGDKLRAFLKLEKNSDSFLPEDWISSFVEAKNRVYIKNEGISQVITENGEALITDAVSDADFGEGRSSSGVLIKLLDAGERLGVQVHPTKERANELFSSAFGKTECWHILDADEGASVYLGFREGITEDIWRELYFKQDIDGMLGAMHKLSVKRGDTILVTAGIPHAIGKGCFLLEIQEPTDYTFRVERTTVAGEKLTENQIHYGVGEDAMLSSFIYSAMSERDVREKHFLKTRKISLSESILVSYDDTECFALSKIEGDRDLNETSFVTVVCTEDGGILKTESEQFLLSRGDRFFISANACVRLISAKALLCYPPKLN